MSNIFVITGPSGSGKDTIVEALKKRLPIERVVTSTTRPMRSNESEGNPYYFISRNEFEEKIKNDELYEYIHGYNDAYYGITKSEVERAKHTGKIVVFRTEYRGVVALKKEIPELISISLTASKKILEQRIRGRDKTAEEEYIIQRLKYNDDFLNHMDVFDYIVENPNGKLDETIDTVEALIRKHLGS